MMKVGVAAAIAFFLFVALLQAQAPGGAPQSAGPQQPAAEPASPSANGFQGLSLGLLPAPDPAAVDRGKQIFTSRCAFCHGANATGGESGPDLIRSVVVLHDQGKGTSIGPVVLNGRPDRGMPKFDFTDSQIKDIAAFLLSRNQAAANRRTYQVLNVVTGDPAAGKAYFDAHCASCHSPTGDLAHVAGKYEPPVLQGRFLYPGRRAADSAPSAPDSRALKTATVVLPSGQSYSGRVLEYDDFSISLLDASGQYRSWELGGVRKIKVQVQDPLEGHLKLLREYTDADIHNVLSYLETLK